MTDKEMVGKCLLTDEELEEDIRKDYKDFLVRDENGYVQDLLTWTCESQLTKAIPIIRKAVEEEIFQGVSGVEMDENISGRVWLGFDIETLKGFGQFPVKLGMRRLRR